MGYQGVMANHEHQDIRRRMAAVSAHIQANLDLPLPLEELAAIACFSPFYFHRLFTAVTGETLGQHLRRLRLERSALRLELTGRSVTELALEAGYDAPGSFCRAFKVRFGESPAVYRQSSRASRALGLQAHVDSPVNQPLPPMGETIMLDVRIVRKEPLRVAAVRHVGPYAECQAAWERLCAWAGPKGLFGRQPLFLGIGYDDPRTVAPDKLRYDACITVPPEVKAEGEVRVFEIPGGEYAVAVHEGPYSGLEAAYDYLFGRWLAESGREPAAHMGYEVYLNDPASTPPEELRTELNLPLAPKS